jgi:hypothetical protein
MTHTYKGYTPQVNKELQAISERDEINELINTSFEPIERKIFYTALYYSLATLIIIPILISLI